MVDKKTFSQYKMLACEKYYEVLSSDSMLNYGMVIERVIFKVLIKQKIIQTKQGGSSYGEV